MTRERRGRVVASGVGALAAGLAFATVVLPQLASTLKPTALGVAVVTACLGLITLIWQYQGARIGRALDAQAALDVPPRPLQDAYFEARSDVTTVPDPRIVAAMRGPRPAVIVRGPPAADKYSVALAAARVACPDFVALVPFDADGLATVQNSGFSVGVRRRDPGVCVWLEDLDRFLETVDPRALREQMSRAARRLGRGPHTRPERDIRLFATIEDRRWTDLNRGTDQPAATLRRLTRTAAVVSLADSGEVTDVTPHPTRQELADADRLIAAAGGNPPATTSSQPQAFGPSPWRDRWLVAAIVMTLVVALTPFALYLSDRRNLVEAPPLSDQMAAIIGDMQRALDHGHVVIDERVRLHETEQKSWIVAVDHGDGSPGDPTTRARRSAIGCSLTYGAHAPSYVYNSDEIRVYDVHDGWLDKELDFQPTLIGSQAATLQAADEARTATNGLYENGITPQFIGGYSVGGCKTPMIVPFAIQWNNQLNPPRYDLKGLTQFSHVSQPDETPVAGPAFATQRVPPAQARFLRKTYTRPVSLKNQARQDGSDTRSLVAYPVSAFAVTLRPSGRLLLGYQLEPFNFEKTNTIELEVGQLRGGGIAVFPCMPSDRTCTGPAVPEQIAVPPDRSINHALLIMWPRLERYWVRRICETPAGATPVKPTRTRRAGPPPRASNCVGPAP